MTDNEDQILSEHEEGEDERLDPDDPASPRPSPTKQIKVEQLSQISTVIKAVPLKSEPGKKQDEGFIDIPIDDTSKFLNFSTKEASHPAVSPPLPLSPLYDEPFESKVTNFKEAYYTRKRQIKAFQKSQETYIEAFNTLKNANMLEADRLIKVMKDMESQL